MCQFEYAIELVPDTATCTPMCKFRALLMRDLLLLMAAVQGAICLLGLAILPALDTRLSRNLLFPSGWAQSAVDYVCGVVLFFAMLGIVGLLVLLVRACSAACGCCCQCCYDPDDAAYERSGGRAYYSGPEFFFCFYPVPSPYYYGHHHVQHHVAHGGAHNCACLGCGSCNCSGSSGGGNGSNDCGALILVVIIVLAVIGVVFAGALALASLHVLSM